MKYERIDLQKDSSSVDDGSSSVRGGGGVSTVPDLNCPQPDPNNGGANTQVQPRRKRGRPPGSTNKSKSPATRPDNNDGVQRPPKLEITRKPDPVMNPCFIEVADGVDVIDAISHYCKINYRVICLSILSVSGAVSKFKLHQLTPTTSSNLEFNGRFDILSLNATFITPSPATESLIQIEPLNVTITVKDHEGQIIGGIVAKPLIASGPVYIAVAVFTHPALTQRLPVEFEGTRINAMSSGRNEQQSPSAAAKKPDEAARSINATSSSGRNEQQSPSAAAEKPEEAARSINATSSAGRNEQQAPSAAAEENNAGGGES
ncbi:unnamed protein product [Rhodiola kirilowii]